MSLEDLVFNETVVPCRWRSETRKLMIEAVDEGRINQSINQSGRASSALIDNHSFHLSLSSIKFARSS